MSSIEDLASYIGVLRHRHARASQSDLCRLIAEHGRSAVSKALELSKQAEFRSGLSIDGQRRARRDARADERSAQAIFQRSKLWR
jgi:hypothetical protein